MKGFGCLLVGNTNFQRIKVKEFINANAQLRVNGEKKSPKQQSSKFLIDTPSQRVDSSERYTWISVSISRSPIARISNGSTRWFGIYEWNGRDGVCACVHGFHETSHSTETTQFRFGSFFSMKTIITFYVRFPKANYRRFLAPIWASDKKQKCIDLLRLPSKLPVSF